MGNTDLCLPGARDKAMRKSMIGMMLFLAAAVMSAEAGRTDWKIGVQCRTFNNKPLMETVDSCADHGADLI